METKSKKHKEPIKQVGKPLSKWQKIIALLWALGFSVTAITLNALGRCGVTVLCLLLGYALIGALCILHHSTVKSLEVGKEGFKIHFRRMAALFLVVPVIGWTIFVGSSKYHSTIAQSKIALAKVDMRDRIRTYVDPLRDQLEAAQIQIALLQQQSEADQQLRDRLDTAQLRIALMSEDELRDQLKTAQHLIALAQQQSEADHQLIFDLHNSLMESQNMITAILLEEEYLPEYAIDEQAASIPLPDFSDTLFRAQIRKDAYARRLNDPNLLQSWIWDSNDLKE